MIERFLEQTHFEDMEDFRKNFRLKIPEGFNFAYDVMDAWAEEEPDKLALLWTNEDGDCKRFTFLDLKILSNRAASYFSSLGIGRGDMVMIMLGRRYEFWITMLAMEKIGAVVIPATDQLLCKDYIYKYTQSDGLS